jgi:isopenicillin N synthase-like dioxygenase
MVTSVDLGGGRAGPALVDALRRDSCAFVTGHGVDADLRRRMVAVTRDFFARSPAEKAAVRWDGTGLWKGWQPVYEGRPELTDTRPPDLLERFEAQEPATFAAWPAAPAGFAATWSAYHDACAALASGIVGMLAAELGLPADALPAWTDGQFANLVANHYLPQPEPPGPGQVRTGVHTDRGGLTLLWAEQAPGGLEVRAPGSDTWTPVAIPVDAFVLQVGDMMARWTNGRIRANVHRVANPPREVAATASRLALVYFHYPALDTRIEPVPSSPGDRLLPVMRARDHLMYRQEHFKASADYVGTP